MGGLYNRRVLNDPEVRLAFSDPLAGIVTPEEFTLELDNTDHYFDTLDLRSERLDLDRYDVFSHENQWELTGLVTSQETRMDRVILRVVAQDLAELQTLLPKRVVTAATFPLAHPTLGLGKPIPIVIGNASSTHKVTDAWEMAYVGEHVGSNQYDFLVGEGTFTNISAYRTTVGDTLFLIPSSEYTVNTTAYPGFTVLRFTVAPKDFGGSYDRRFVAADGLQSERNGATAVKSLLSNATWGLGLSVNAASFTTAASDWDAVGGLYVDGVISEQRSALDWLNDILIMRGLRPERNSHGEWTLSVMKNNTTIKALLGHGATQTNNGIVAGGFGGLKKVSTTEAIKSLILDYRYSAFEDRFTLATSARTPFAFGRESRIENRMIRDRTTADKVACFLGLRHQYAGEMLSCTADMAARQLRPGELFRYQSDAPVFNTVFLVQGLRRKILAGTTDLDGVGYDSAIFTYTPGTLPAEPADTTPTDYTRQTPTAASSLTIASSGTESNGQGGFAAFVVLQYTVPAETWANTYVKFRRNGATNWQIAAIRVDTGANLQTKVTGLITGASYDYAISRVNVVSPTLSATDLTLTNQTAPTDAIAPGTPGTPTIVGQHLKDITFQWPESSGGDVEDYEFEIRNASGGGGTLAVTGRAGTIKTSLTLHTLAYITTYYFRVRGHDYSGNDSAWSSDRSFALTRGVTDDVDDNAMTVNGSYSYDGTRTPDTTELEVGTITISTNGGAGQVIGKVRVSVTNTTASGGGVIVRIRKDSISGTVMDYGMLGLTIDAITLVSVVTVVAIDSAPSGSQTYKLTVQAENSDIVVSTSYHRLLAVNFKK